MLERSTRARRERFCEAGTRHASLRSAFAETCAPGMLHLVITLKRVLLPTFGMPTIPICSETQVCGVSRESVRARRRLRRTARKDAKPAAAAQAVALLRASSCSGSKDLFLSHLQVRGEAPEDGLLLLRFLLRRHCEAAGARSCVRRRRCERPGNKLRGSAERGDASDGSCASECTQKRRARA